MSQDIKISFVSRINTPVPTVINRDNEDITFAHCMADGAYGWQKEIGVPFTIQYTTVDEFDAVEKMVGEKPTSIRYEYQSWGERGGSGRTCYFANRPEIYIAGERFEPYKHLKSVPSYAYNERECLTIENAYNVNIKDYADRLLQKEEILEIVKKYFAENDENDLDQDSNYCTAPVFCLMKAYCDVGEGEHIVLEYE